MRYLIRPFATPLAPLAAWLASRLLRWHYSERPLLASAAFICWLHSLRRLWSDFIFRKAIGLERGPYAPGIYARKGSNMEAILARCPTLTGGYAAPRALCTGDLTTLAATLWGRAPALAFERLVIPVLDRTAGNLPEPVERADPEYFVLDWLQAPPIPKSPVHPWTRTPMRNSTEPAGTGASHHSRAKAFTTPVLLVLAGVGGDSGAGYVRSVCAHAHARGWHCAVLIARGMGDTRVRALQALYDPADPTDLRATLRLFNKALPSSPVVLCGFSLGAVSVASFLAQMDAGTPPTPPTPTSFPAQSSVVPDPATHTPTTCVVHSGVVASANQTRLLESPLPSDDSTQTAAAPAEECGSDARRSERDEYYEGSNVVCGVALSGALALDFMLYPRYAQLYQPVIVPALLERLAAKYGPGMRALLGRETHERLLRQRDYRGLFRSRINSSPVMM
jgi:hypothetical protein